MNEDGSRVRRQIAVVVSRFPLITETFILREIIELERQGQPVLLVPMIRENPTVVHPEALPWVERALFTPWLSLSIVAANLRMFVRRPIAYLAAAGALLTGMFRSPRFLVSSVALFPKSVFLAEHLAAAGIRHVHAHFATHPATIAMIIARLAPEISFSITAHAHDIFVNRTMLGAKLMRAVGVRVISRFNRGYLSALFPRVPPGKIEVIRVGIEPDAYRASPVSMRPFRILTVAGLKPYKGVRILVEACATLRRRALPFVCEIVGDGPLRRSLETQIARAGLGQHVRLVGARTQHEVAEMMRAASVFVLPSIIARDGQMEGIPVALMEAMAASRPVVASALSGIPELVEDEVTGLLVDPNNPELLASAIARLANDSRLASRLAEAGRERVVAEFSLERNVARLLTWIDRFNPPLELGPSMAADGCAIGVREFHRTRDSCVARVILCDPERRETTEAVIKEHLARAGESAPPAVRAEREARLLAEVYASSAQRGEWTLTVPEALRHKEAVVVMRAARGMRLDQLVRRERFRASHELEAGVTGAAAWLRWFHDSDRRDGVRLHGDFWPGNVFVDGRTITAIDLEGAHRGHPVEDVAHFLVHLELFFPPPLRGAFRRLRNAFLREYYGNEVPTSELVRSEAAVAETLRRSLAGKGLRGRLALIQLSHHGTARHSAGELA